MFNQELLEGADVVSAFVPVDMSAGANSGDWVNLENYDRAVALVFKAAGTAGDDPVFTLLQAQDASGTGAKALTFTRIRSKVGTLSSVGQWTLNTQTAANTYTDAASAEAQALLAVEIQAADLDVSNGFKFIQLSVPDVGNNAQLGCGFYVLHGARYKREVKESALA